jgi:two-component system response regulator AtoC
MAPEVAEIFRHYRWPGNVRELRNVIERALILEDEDVITTAYLPRDLEKGRGGVAPPDPLTQASSFTLPGGGVALEEVEQSLVRQAIERSGGNQTRAAALLGISRDQLRYRLKKIEEAQG